MNKHNKLSEKELLNHEINPRTLKWLIENNHHQSTSKVLDWGCGRGRDMTKIAESGFDVYGVDIDIIPISNSLNHLKIQQISKDNCRTNFEDNYFDYIVSNQVFEHVENLDSVANENYRILKKNGKALHIYPAKFSFRENHLFMPLVHWLPKNFLRLISIYFFVIFGIHPHWEQFKSLSLKEKAIGYYKYSINKTFYRSTHEVINIFKKKGFKVDINSLDHPKVINNIFGKVLLNFNFGKKFIKFFVKTFYLHELRLTKIN